MSTPDFHSHPGWLIVVLPPIVVIAMATESWYPPNEKQSFGVDESRLDITCSKSPRHGIPIISITSQFSDNQAMVAGGRSCRVLPFRLVLDEALHLVCFFENGILNRSGWWFGCHFWHFPICWEFLIIPTDFHIFQRGSKHQPVIEQIMGGWSLKMLFSTRKKMLNWGFHMIFFIGRAGTPRTRHGALNWKILEKKNTRRIP